MGWRHDWRGGDTTGGVETRLGGWRHDCKGWRHDWRGGDTTRHIKIKEVRLAYKKFLQK